jgi:hypothetical protein
MGLKLVSNTRGRTWINGVCEEGTEENIQTYGGGSGKRMETSHFYYYSLMNRSTKLLIQYVILQN